MAKKTIVQLIDDIDGTVLEHGKGQSIDFSMDGKSYSIDLSDKNARAFRNSMKKYIDHAKPAGTARRGSRAGKSSGSGRSASELKDIRQWAQDNGYTIAPRGRISTNVLQAYDAAKGK